MDHPLSICLVITTNQLAVSTEADNLWSWLFFSLRA